MINKKQLLTSVVILVSVYLLLLLPALGGSKMYGDFYRKQGFYFFNNFGEKGFVVFEEHEDTGQDDTRVYQANKSLASANGDVVSVPFNISIRILAYLPVILLISLFAATPIKIWKRAVLMVAGFAILHALLMSFLYILLLSKYINTPKLEMYQDMGNSTKSLINYLNSSINHGMGLNSFLVVIIWLGLVFYFERNVLSKFLQSEK